MSINDGIFKAYDIRGLYPQEFDEEAAYAIARAVALFLNAKSITVATDNRPSSPLLKEAVLNALNDAGVNVVDVGITTTPMFYFAVNMTGTDGGIMITASHNPPEYNGLKITSHEARPVGEASGLVEIKNIAQAGNFPKAYADGSFVKRNYLEEYVNLLVKDISVPDGIVVVDAACGYAGTVLSEIARRTGLTLKGLCFPPCKKHAHEADPLKNENVRDIIAALQSGAGEFGVALDGDGDRIFFFDKNGGRIPSHVVGSLLAQCYLKQYPGAVMISDARMPKVFEETVVAAGGRHVENRVGHAYIKKRMREEGAVFAAEVSGHFYFKDFFGVDSGLFAFTRVLDIVARENKPLKELAAPFMKRFQSGELNYKVADVAMTMDRLEKALLGGRISRIDGLSVYFPDWWCNIRPSNTEPFLRVNIEAETPELLASVRDRIEEIITT